MQRNILHYQRALFLRKKKGYSYREILREVPVAKSTLSAWFKDVTLSEQQRRRIQKNGRDLLNKHNHSLGEWNRKKRQEEVRRLRVTAKESVGKLSDREAFISGIMLYWAEGAKTGGEVSIANSDPVFIKFMMEWFRKYLQVPEERFRASLHYHQGQSEQELKQFWSQLTGIPQEHFYKSFCKPPGTGHRTHYLQWGTFSIRVKKSTDL